MPTVSGEPEWLKKALDEARREGRLREGSVPPPPAGHPARPKKKRGRPEYEFQTAVIAYAQLKGWTVAHFRSVPVRDKRGNVYHQTPVDADGAGFPDLLMVRGARMVAAELKSATGSVSPEQRAWLARLALAGAETFVWFPSDLDTAHKVLA